MQYICWFYMKDFVSLILNCGSLQFKEAANVFGKGRAALSGKVGGMKDDVVSASDVHHA